MIPDDVEKIIMTKEDYDRNVEQLLFDKCKAELEIERLNNRLKTSNDTCNYLRNTIDKAIEYIDRRDIEWGSEEHNILLSILKGSDKE